MVRPFSLAQCSTLPSHTWWNMAFLTCRARPLGWTTLLACRHTRRALQAPHAMPHRTFIADVAMALEKHVITSAPS